jgi:hypothetical protein
MPIIYLKNPSRGSHFRTVNAATNPRSAQQTGNRVIAWASCSSPFRMWVGHVRGLTFTNHAFRDIFGIVRGIESHVISGFTARVHRSRTAFTSFKKPCR